MGWFSKKTNKSELSTAIDKLASSPSVEDQKKFANVISSHVEEETGGPMPIHQDENGNRLKIITVFKTHVDIGFTDLPQKVIEKYSTNMLVDAIETCEKTATFDKDHRFVWTLPSFPLYHALRTADSEIIDRCQKVIKNDQLKWHALPFTLRTEFFNKKFSIWSCFSYIYS